MANLLALRTAMVQVKCDWEALGNTLHFPRWDNVAGICHKCRCLKEQVLEVELGAF